MRNIREELIVEQSALDSKITKLTTFVRSHEVNEVSHHMWDAMREQLDAMNAYSKALGRRISLPK